ncbi:hypothetical protein LINGRAHAP2_LOCUS34527, partial [Linum grandiflorum]
MRGTSPEVESRPPKRTVNCGHYREEGHNSRRCYMLRGILAQVNPNTSAQARQRELRTVEQGVGAYTNPVTGNSYYRGGP